jgi:hypothetical protein
MSSIISMRRKEEINLDFDFKLFRNIVKAGFNQRRKMLRGALKSLVPDPIPLLAAAGIARYDWYPMIRGRLVAINGKSVRPEEMAEERARRKARGLPGNNIAEVVLVKAAPKAIIRLWSRKKNTPFSHLCFTVSGRTPKLIFWTRPASTILRAK